MVSSDVSAPESEGNMPVGRWLLRCVIIAAAVMASDTLVFRSAAQQAGLVNMVYPTAGVSLALLWWWGWRHWPGVLVGSALTSWYFFGPGAAVEGGLGAELSASGVVLGLLVAGTAVPDALAAGVGAACLGGAAVTRSAPLLSRVWGALRFIAVAAFVVPGISTVLSVPTVWPLTGRPGEWVQFAEVWWVSQLLGTLMLPPLLVTWGQRSAWTSLREDYGPSLVAVLVAIAAVGVVSFSPWALPVPMVTPLALGLPLLGWAAIGWQVRGATAGLAVLGSFALIGTVSGYGPLPVLLEHGGTLYNFELALAALGVTPLLLAAAMAERARQRDAIERQRASLALQRDRLRILSRQLLDAEHRERRALAERLHDGMHQHLAVAQLALQNVDAGDPPGASPAGAAALARVRVGLDRAVEESRAVINDLAPPALSLLGLHAALGGLARRFEAQYNLPVSYRPDPPAQRPALEVEAFLYRVAQEFLINIVKHAPGAAAGIAYSAGPEGVRLIVWDDGDGFDLDAALHQHPDETTGFGLFSIHEQAASMGGTLRVTTNPQRGLTVVLPG